MSVEDIVQSLRKEKNNDMKNFVKESQKLPLYGIGPCLVFTMATVTAIGIALFYYILRIIAKV